MIEIKDSERTRCEIWSRVMGYHRPVHTWNLGKQQEHEDRAHFIEPSVANCPKFGHSISEAATHNGSRH